MKTTLVSVAALAISAATMSFHCFGHPSPAHPVTPAASTEGTELLARLPVAFVPNLGQWENPARFVARTSAMTVFLERKGWTFTLVERRSEKEKENASARGVAVRMTFAGASTPELTAEDRLPGRHHYFLGDDRSKWRSDVPLYCAVRYRELYPGVDVRAREQDGHFEFDLLLQPRAELDAVEIAVEGIERMHLGADRALVLETQLGHVRMPAPLTWEEGPSGERSPVTCRYVLRGEDRFGFEVTSRRPGWAMVVDPGLLWSTFLGGTDTDEVHALALDAQGAATVAGVILSNDFPTTLGAFDTTRNDRGWDAFVTKLSPTGSSLVYSTFLGGTAGDLVHALALDAQGAATVAGETYSSNFPTTLGAFDRSFNGLQDAFVTRLSPTGSSLVYSTFLGGTGVNYASALALDAQGAATVAGRTDATNFPTTLGAFDTSFNGVRDAFVTRLSPTGSSLVYSTFLGGAGFEEALALALDARGAATVAGWTGSAADFPTTPGAFDTSHNGGNYDAFVTQLSPTGSSLVYSTFLGGTSGDFAHALTLDAQGAATVAGDTDSADFPTTSGAFDGTHNGASDVFVAKLSPTGSSLVYSTFLGGALRDEVGALALDAQGAATVAGFTQNTTFPTTPGAFDTSFDGVDAFVTRLSLTGSSLVYSTFLGGTNSDSASELALDAQGAATVAGGTWSSDFPTTPGAFDTSFNGGSYDVFVTRLDMLPTGVDAFGLSSSGCTGPLAISVSSMPSVGNASFALTCGNAPPSASGALVLAASGLTTPIPLLGIEVWLDPFSAYFFGFDASSNSWGACEFTVPIPSAPTLIGQQLDAQFFWAGPTAPPPCPTLGISASNALEITIQS